MYNNLNKEFSWADSVSYSSCNTNESFKRTLDTLNQKYKVGNFFVTEAVRRWNEGYYDEMTPAAWSALFVAQIVEYSPAEGTMNIFTGKKRITKLPHLVVKAPDGTKFEPLVFTDDGKSIKASATVSAVKSLLENACIKEIATEDFNHYCQRIWMSATKYDIALSRYNLYNILKEKTAEELKSEYAARRYELEERKRISEQQAENKRKADAITAESRKMFKEFFD